MTEHESQQQPEQRKPRVGQSMRGFRTSSLLILVSRILGLVRDMGTAALFGIAKSPALDAFVFAFRLPDLFRRFFGEGTLTATFIPALTREFDNESDSESHGAWRLLSQVLSTVATVGIVILLISELLLLFVWPSGTNELTRDLTMLLAPFVLLITLTSILSSSLLSIGRFAYAGLPPIILNLMWILVLLLINSLRPSDPQYEVAILSGGIMFAGAVQLCTLWLVLLRCGFRFRFSLVSAKDMARYAALNLMLVIILGITHLNTFLDSLIAWWLSSRADSPIEPGAISALYFGERLYMFPLGLVGIAAVSGFYPTMSRYVAREQFSRARVQLVRALEMIGVLGFPATAGLVLIAKPLTSLFFERGQFTAADSLRASGIVVGYSVGLIAFSMLPLVIRSMILTGQVKALAQTTIAIIACNVLFNILFGWQTTEWSLPWTTSILAFVQLVVLFSLVRFGDGGRPPLIRLIRCWIRSLGCTIFMTVACWMTYQLLQSRSDLLICTCVVAVGCAAYAASSLVVQRRAVMRLVR